MKLPRAAYVIFAVAIFIRMLLVVFPLPVFHDVDEFFRWGQIARDNGFGQVYSGWPIPAHYPPVSTHIFGALMTMLGHDASLRAFNIVLKSVQFILEFVLAYILYAMFRKKRSERTGLFAASLFLFNPVVLFDIGYWGQFDILYTLLIFSAFLLIGSNAKFSLPLLAIAVLVKPQAAVYAVLCAVILLLNKKYREFLIGALWSSVVVLFLLLPFILDRTLSRFIDFVALAPKLIPVVTANAHNAWMIAINGTGNIVYDWEKLSPFPLTYQMAGFLLVLFTLLIIVLWYRKHVLSDRDEALFLAAGFTGFSFFLLSTEIHENHLFSVLPFFLCLAVLNNRWRWMYYYISLTLFFNLLLQDPYFGVHFFDRTLYHYVSFEMLRTGNGIVALVGFLLLLVNLTPWKFSSKHQAPQSFKAMSK